MSTQPNIFKPKLQELGRIRIGDQVPTGKGKATRPRRLETFRMTSRNKPLLHAAAALYGGDVTEWPEAPEDRQWQLTTETNNLPVTVPPFGSISQAFERWSGGGCQLRCDGCTISHAADPTVIGTPCVCPPDHTERSALAIKGEACNPITRLSVIMPNLPGIGVWRLDTRGFYAGSELAGIVPFLEAAAVEGMYLSCMLQLETRTVKRNNDTLIFPVVTLQPANINLQQLLTKAIPDSALIAPPQIPRVSQIEAPEEMTAEDAAANLFGEASTPIASPVHQVLTEHEGIAIELGVGEAIGSDLGIETVTEAEPSKETDEEEGKAKERVINRWRDGLIEMIRRQKITVRDVKKIIDLAGGGTAKMETITDGEVLANIEAELIRRSELTSQG